MTAPTIDVTDATVKVTPVTGGFNNNGRTRDFTVSPYPRRQVARELSLTIRALTGVDEVVSDQEANRLRIVYTKLADADTLTTLITRILQKGAVEKPIDVPLKPLVFQIGRNGFSRSSYVIETNFRHTDEGLLESLRFTGGGGFEQAQFNDGGYNLFVEAYGSFSGDTILEQVRRRVNAYYGLGSGEVRVERSVEDEEGYNPTTVVFDTTGGLNGYDQLEELSTKLRAMGMGVSYADGSSSGSRVLVSLANSLFSKDEVAEAVQPVILEFFREKTLVA